MTTFHGPTPSLVMLAFVASCRHPIKTDPLPLLREDARAIVSQHCGECHDPRRSTALPGALAVYDVTEPDWSARMSDAQLRNAIWRLSEPIPPEGRPNDVSDQERALFGRYVELEITRRAALTSGSPDASP
jgi:mono/diheme cytochrome c family protein